MPPVLASPSPTSVGTVAGSETPGGEAPLSISGFPKGFPHGTGGGTLHVEKGQGARGETRGARGETRGARQQKTNLFRTPPPRLVPRPPRHFFRTGDFFFTPPSHTRHPARNSLSGRILSVSPEGTFFCVAQTGSRLDTTRRSPALRPNRLIHFTLVRHTTGNAVSQPYPLTQPAQTVFSSRLVPTNHREGDRRMVRTATRTKSPVSSRNTNRDLPMLGR